MKTTARLPRLLAATAALPFAVAVALWGLTGASLGWTRTSAVVMQHDEITGIDYPVHQPDFVAGVEVLALGFVATVALALVALVARRFAPGRA